MYRNVNLVFTLYSVLVIPTLLMTTAENEVFRGLRLLLLLCYILTLCSYILVRRERKGQQK